MIAAIVEQRRPVVGEKGQYGYVRVSEDPVKKTKRAKRNRSPAEEEPTVAGPSGQVGEAPVHMQMLHDGISMYTSPMSVPYFPAPGTGPLDPVPASLLRNGGDTLDGDESAGWAIRIGDGPPPAWARKEANPQEDEESSPRKKARLECVPVSL
jgi:hypothetical protein